MEALLLIAVIAAAVWWYRRATHGSARSKAGPVVARLGDATGVFDFAIVGESNYQPALRELAGEGEVRHVCQALIYLEDDNPYDAKAIRVDIDGETVGYFSCDDARAYRKQMASVGSIVGKCGAVIVGGGNGRSLGVWLDLPIK